MYQAKFNLAKWYRAPQLISSRSNKLTKRKSCWSSAAPARAAPPSFVYYPMTVTPSTKYLVKPTTAAWITRRLVNIASR